jgi:hypothetical protein
MSLFFFPWPSQPPSEESGSLRSCGSADRRDRFFASPIAPFSIAEGVGRIQVLYSDFH